MTRLDPDKLNRARQLVAELRESLGGVLNDASLEKLDQVIRLLDPEANGDAPPEPSIEQLTRRRRQADPMDGQPRREATPEYDQFRGLLLVRFAGNSMEEATFEHVNRHLEKRMAEGVDPVAIVDMAGLRDLSDRALMSLALLSRTALGNQGVVILCRLESTLREKMGQMHLDRMLKIVASPEEACLFLDDRRPGEGLRELLIRSMFEG